MARRGDVVFVQLPHGSDIKAMHAAAMQAEAVHEATGVTVVFLGAGAGVVGLVPLRRLRARRGPTPRWMR